ncbi:MAG: hypothetical protein IJ640_08450 [Prevotella sp.]|nr:hypothetical protein [Prevotella sp.]
MNYSQKKVLDYYKQTKGEFNVYAFNAETKKRESAYTGLDCLTAFQEMVNKAHKGFLILVLDNEGSNNADVWEIKNGGRISYDICKQWAIKTYVMSNSISRV